MQDRQLRREKLLFDFILHIFFFLFFEGGHFLLFLLLLLLISFLSEKIQKQHLKHFSFSIGEGNLISGQEEVSFFLSFFLSFLLWFDLVSTVSHSEESQMNHDHNNDYRDKKKKKKQKKMRKKMQVEFLCPTRADCCAVPHWFLINDIMAVWRLIMRL